MRTNKNLLVKDSVASTWAGMGGRHQGVWKSAGRRCLDQAVGGGLDHLEQQVSRAYLFSFTLLVQRLMERLELKHCVT